MSTSAPAAFEDVLVGTDGSATSMKLTPPPKVLRMQMYAAEIECSEPETRHWMHRWCIEKNGGHLALIPPMLIGTDLQPTVSNVFKVAAQKHGSKNCMGVRKIEMQHIEGKKQYWQKGAFAWRTYTQIYTDVEAAAKGLFQMAGIGEKRCQSKQVVAAIMAETSQEWMISAQAALACGLTLTTVYATLGHDAMMHGLHETEAEVIFLDWSLYKDVKETVLAKCPALRHIIFIGKDLIPEASQSLEHSPFPALADILLDVGLAHCTTLDNVILKGTKGPESAAKQIDLSAVAPTSKDIAMIMYTSGSTGMPKGVVLTHENFVSVVASTLAQGTITPKPAEVVIAYLPLAHILELLVEMMSFSQGACVGYAHPRTLTASSPYVKTNSLGVPEAGFESDLMVLRPSVMAAVPAVLDLIAGGLKKKFQTGLFANLFNGAVARRMGRPAWCGIFSFIDKKLITTVKTAIGLDRIRLLVSGGAPLSSETQEFVQAVFAPVAQGYGATETAACSTIQECFGADGRPADLGGGRVGAIQPANEIKLLSVPHMGYLVTDSPPRGEILVAGNNVTQHGYYKLPKETAKSFIKHSDGKIWFHTGDIGVMEEDGVLKIVDRKKDLIKLQGGEYVSLGKVEANLKQVPAIGACCVFAQSDKTFCVVIVSQPEKGWKSVGGRPIEADLVAEIAIKMKEVGLLRFEVPTKVAVDDTIWTPETGLVTVSMKLQRNALRQFYNLPGGHLDKMGYLFQ